MTIDGDGTGYYRCRSCGYPFTLGPSEPLECPFCRAFSRGLLPCPICGSPACLDWYADDYDQEIRAQVSCDRCGCNTGPCETPADAVDSWNYRTVRDPATSSTGSALKPCPSCGGIPEVEQRPDWGADDHSNRAYYYVVCCTECLIQTARYYETDGGENGAIAAWNNRPISHEKGRGNVRRTEPVNGPSRDPRRWSPRRPSEGPRRHRRGKPRRYRDGQHAPRKTPHPAGSLRNIYRRKKHPPYCLSVRRTG